MPFLVGCLALISARLAVFAVWLFSSYFSRAYEHWIFPLLGFFFLPLTTLAFAFGVNSLGAPGQMPPLGWLITAIALVIDLGLTKKGHSDYRKRERRD